MESAQTISLFIQCQINATQHRTTRHRLVIQIHQSYLKMPLITKMKNFKLERWNRIMTLSQRIHLVAFNANQINKWVPTRTTWTIKATKWVPRKEAERPIPRRAKSSNKRWDQILNNSIPHQRNNATNFQPKTALGLPKRLKKSAATTMIP